MKEFLKSSSDIKEISIAERADGSAAVSIGGDNLEIRDVARNGPEIRFALGGKSFSFLVSANRKKITVWRDGAVHTFERAEGKSVGAGGAADSASSLSSQMPGIVLKLLRNPGDEVAAGAPLLILEAMKMEHEIAAPSDGKVVSYPFAEGQRVMPGDLLVEFEANVPVG
ncbi:MAG: biotin/lipoyl-binding protein [bacterium]|jgi:biotin carboxyl carrier protein